MPRYRCFGRPERFHERAENFGTAIQKDAYLAYLQYLAECIFAICVRKHSYREYEPRNINSAIAGIRCSEHR